SSIWFRTWTSSRTSTTSTGSTRPRRAGTAEHESRTRAYRPGADTTPAGAGGRARPRTGRTERGRPVTPRREPSAHRGVRQALARGAGGDGALPRALAHDVARTARAGARELSPLAVAHSRGATAGAAEQGAPAAPDAGRACPDPPGLPPLERAAAGAPAGAGAGPRSFPEAAAGAPAADHGAAAPLPEPRARGEGTDGQKSRALADHVARGAAEGARGLARAPPRRRERRPRPPASRRPKPGPGCAGGSPSQPVAGHMVNWPSHGPADRPEVRRLVGRRPREDQERGPPRGRVRPPGPPDGGGGLGHGQ